MKLFAKIFSFLFEEKASVTAGYAQAPRAGRVVRREGAEMASRGVMPYGFFRADFGEGSSIGEARTEAFAERGAAWEPAAADGREWWLSVRNFFLRRAAERAGEQGGESGVVKTGQAGAARGAAGEPAFAFRTEEGQKPFAGASAPAEENSFAAEPFSDELFAGLASLRGLNVAERLRGR